MLMLIALSAETTILMVCLFKLHKIRRKKLVHQDVERKCVGGARKSPAKSRRKKDTSVSEESESGSGSETDLPQRKRGKSRK